MVYDTPVVESIPMTRFVPGQTNAVPYGHYVDKKSFTWRAVTKSTGHRNGDCDSYAEAEFDLVQFDSHFDKKGIRKMRIRIRDVSPEFDFENLLLLRPLSFTHHTFNDSF